MICSCTYSYIHVYVTDNVLTNVVTIIHYIVSGKYTCHRIVEVGVCYLTVLFAVHVYIWLTNLTSIG